MTEKQSPKAAPILMVDDSADDFEAVRRAFKKSGFTDKLDHASSGEAAIDYLRGGNKLYPCLILLDLNMPGMGGRKALEMIKQDNQFRQIPVVVLTTSNHEADIAMCYALGANTYIQKPVNYDILCLDIRKVKEYWLEIALLPPQLKEPGSFPP